MSDQTFPGNAQKRKKNRQTVTNTFNTFSAALDFNSFIYRAGHGQSYFPRMLQHYTHSILCPNALWAPYPFLSRRLQKFRLEKVYKCELLWGKTQLCLHPFPSSPHIYSLNSFLISSKGKHVKKWTCSLFENQCFPLFKLYMAHLVIKVVFNKSSTASLYNNVHFSFIFQQDFPKL